MATVLGPQEMLQSPTGTWGSVQYPNDYTGGQGKNKMSPLPDLKILVLQASKTKNMSVLLPFGGLCC